MQKTKPATRSVKAPTAINALFRAKYESSGLTERVVSKLALKVTSAQTAPEWLPTKSDGFLIPYFDIKGKATAFQRWRYLTPPTQTGFAALTNRKPLKYVQPPKSASELYLPPLLSWGVIAEDTASTILITEGELKAAAATSLTPYPCIGIGGVWSFKAAAKHQPYLPAFDLFKWEGRSVYIVYDSDAVTNPMVMQAENALARMLLDKGAEPHIVRLPPHKGAKCGLDDYLVTNGLEPFEQLLEETATWQSAQELHKLNEEVVYVRDPGLILRLDNLQRMAPHAFTDHAYSTRVYYEETITKGKGGKQGVQLVARSAPKEWLKWPSRAEVARTVYAPGAERVTERRELNVWPGWAVQPVPGDVSKWTKLLDHLFGGDKLARTWFERWCAYPIQHPGVKMFSSSVVWGLQHGTGKSFVGYSLGKVYGKNFVEISDEDLRTTHNEWAENRQFVMGDEITGGDKRATSDRMKSMITRQKFRLNIKYIPSYDVVDCINYYFTSNHPDSFFLEDNDRRFFIWEVLSPPLGDKFFHDYEDWIGDQYTIGPGVSALFHHLLTLPIGDFDPRAKAPMTDAKQAMLGNNRSDLATWVAMLKEDPDTVLRMDKVILTYKLWRSEELVALYNPDGNNRVTANGISRELSRQGFRKAARGFGIPTRVAGQIRLWALRDCGAMEDLSGPELGEQYDRERGMVIKHAKPAPPANTKAPPPTHHTPKLEAIKADHIKHRERDGRTRLNKLKRIKK